MLRKFAFSFCAIYSFIKTFEYSKTDNDLAFYSWIAATVIFIVISGPVSKKSESAE